jgi:hypothetical protein
MSAPDDLRKPGIEESVGCDPATLDQGDSQALPLELERAEDAHNPGTDDRHVKRFSARLRHIRFVYEHARFNPIVPDRRALARG